MRPTGISTADRNPTSVFRTGESPRDPTAIYSGRLRGRSDGNGGIPMKTLAQKVQHFLVSEDGPTAVEYAVMLALIVIVCLTAITAVGTKASGTFNKVATRLPS